MFDKQSLRNLINEHPCEVVLERSLALLWSLSWMEPFLTLLSSLHLVKEEEASSQLKPAVTQQCLCCREGCVSQLLGEEPRAAERC